MKALNEVTHRVTGSCKNQHWTPGAAVTASETHEVADTSREGLTTPQDHPAALHLSGTSENLPCIHSYNKYVRTH